MGLRYNDYLSGNKIYGCKNCKTHLANHDDIISRVRFSWLTRPVSPATDSQLPLLVTDCC